MPTREPSIPHYRTVSEETVKPSANLMDIIDMVEERQLWAKDLLVDWGTEPLPFAGAYTVDSSIRVVVDAIRNLLQISTIDWARQHTTWQKAFKFLIERTEEAGIFVVVNGVVGTNNRKALSVEEFRGFVLYDEIAPFVFINGKDAVAGKIFTLVHEIAHVLIGESASFNLSFHKEHDNKIEQFCNQVAANFLVPEALLERYYNGAEEERPYEQLARRCKVSQVVIARRLLDTQRISRAQFFRFYKGYTAPKPSVKKKGGGDFYRSVPYRVSSRFFDIVHTAMLQNSIRPTDAFRLTGLKTKTYNSFLKKHRGE